MIYKVIGVDRKTAEDRELICEHDTERKAMDHAYSEGIAVQRIEELKEAKSKPPKKKQVPEKIQYTSAHESFEDIPKRKDKKTNRAEYNRNVGMIAMGVFVGLLAFSCASPFIIVIVTAVLRVISKI